MGNAGYRQTAGNQPQQDPRNYFAIDLPKFIMQKKIGDGKFMKTYHVKVDGSPFVVKVYMKFPDENLKNVSDNLSKIWNSLSSTKYPNLSPYQMWIKSSVKMPKTNASPVYLIRQYFYANMHDRLSTRPFLCQEEKLWLVYQLVRCVEICHLHNVVHGDIKPENVMCSTWNWLVLTDFSHFKPTMVPDDDPTDFQYFFDTMGRSSCYLAPERFFHKGVKTRGDGNDMDADEGLGTKKVPLTPQMDVFALGCTIAEIFCDGEVLLDLPKMLQYINSPHVTRLDHEDSPARALINRIPIPLIRDVVVDMTQKNPELRSSPNSYRYVLEGRKSPLKLSTIKEASLTSPSRDGSPSDLTPGVGSGIPNPGTGTGAAATPTPNATFPPYFSKCAQHMFTALHIKGSTPDDRIAIVCEAALALIERHSRDTTKPLRILCLCYTNHALDSFLESLLAAGIPENGIIRLGASPTMSARMKERTLVGESNFDRTQNSRFAACKRQQEEEAVVLKKANKLFCTFRSEIPSAELLTFLPIYHCDEYKALFLTYGNVWASWINGVSFKQMEVVLKRSETMKRNWRETPSAKEFVAHLWNLSVANRQALVEKWEDEWSTMKVAIDVDEVVEAFDKYERAVHTIDELRSEAKVSLLKKATVIGCTTTAAARDSALLELAEPTVVLVEEAGQVLESHVLTSLHPTVKQLIMIGDHLQLRPRLEHYPLKKESGRQINFDVSLFERLALQRGFPLQVLDVQHRMRPEISSLVRQLTYPNLKDHPSVLNRPNIRGLTSNVVFIAHNESETQGYDDGVDSLDRSKGNDHEADMVVEVATYLLRQGYSPSDMVILTPYLGQLVKIESRLRLSRINVSISDNDKADLSRAAADLDIALDIDASRAGAGAGAGTPDKAKLVTKRKRAPQMQPMQKRTGPSPKRSVRVATIDNYQGEESPIVIASLVRSNSNNEIGFLAGAERVNVLLSRARNGLVIIGNPHTLTNAHSSKGKAVWSKVMTQLRQNDFVKTGLPIECQCHRNRPPFDPSTPEAFRKFSPEGGCTQSCGMVIHSCPHGHLCTRKCHPLVNSKGEEDDHSAVDCQHILNEFCPRGHAVARICSRPRQFPCMMLVRDDCQMGHFRERVCSDPPTDRCQACDQAQLELLQAQVEANDRAKHQSEKRREKEMVRDLLQLRLAEESEINASRDSAERASAEALLLESELRALASATATVLTAEQPKHALVGRSNASNSNLPPLNNADDDEEIMRSRENVPHQPSSSDLEVSHNVAFDKTPEGGQQDGQPEFLRGSQFYSFLAVISSTPMSNLFDAAAQEDWLNVLDLSQAQTDVIERVNFDVQSLGAEPIVCGKLLSATVLHHLARFQLGDPASSVYASLKKLMTVGESDFGKKHLPTLEEFMCLACYAMAIVAHKIGNIPATARNHARHFVQFSTSATMQFSELNKSNLPKTWIKKAQDISQLTLATEQKISTEVLSSAQEWERIKASQPNAILNASAIASIDDLMGMVGLEEVKKAFITQYHKACISAEQGILSGDYSLNARFDGNPGTGKSTVAQIYANYLMEIGVISNTSIIHATSGATLISRRLSDLISVLGEMKIAGGGVVLVDEAYQLSPDKSNEGKLLLDFILSHSERLDGTFGPIVWIFAGYKKLMDELFENNMGLPSRFPVRFHFDDYTDVELLKIFLSILQNGGGHKQHNNKVKNVGQGVRPPLRKTDKWGNCWELDSEMSIFRDEHQNVCQDPDRLGELQRPLITQGNVKWFFDEEKRMWFNESGDTVEHCPGHPLPPVPFTLADIKWGRIAMRRIGKGRGRMGFGNARAVRAFFDTARGRQAMRITNLRSTFPTMSRGVDLMELSRDDLLGPKATEAALQSLDAWRDLKALEGLDEVKAELQKLLQLVILNADREEIEKPLLDVTLNRIFLGNPGTGKTTVATLYGRILAGLGLLSKGEVILKTPSDFIGSFLGSSEAQTRSILEEAMGSVLVIDEAYSLLPTTSTGGTNQDSFRTAAIDTIVEQVQGAPGEDRAVLLLGYRKQMEDMLAAANPGLSRRFQMENALVFEDYSDDSLVRILRKRCDKDGVLINLSTAQYGIQQLGKARAHANFGNAGAVNNLLSMAKLNMQKRLSLLPPNKRVDELTREDFASLDLTAPESDDAALFAGLVACDSVIAKLGEYRDTIALCKTQGKDPKQFMDFNFVFAGSPGTGKTTVARRMGKLFSSLGLIPSDEVLEISASDFVTGYMGQAVGKTVDILMKAKGKVLFIDEAYRLNPQHSGGGGYMQEVVDEMVKALTSQELKGQMIVILAGYQDEMNKMLDVNPGLRSRFPETIVFEDFNPTVVEKLLARKLSDTGMLTEDVASVLGDVADALIKAPGFANGRDVDDLFKRIYRTYAKHHRKANGQLSALNREQVMEALDELKESKAKLSSPKSGSQSMEDKSNVAFESLFLPPLPSTIGGLKIDEGEAPDIGTKEEATEVNATGIWNESQKIDFSFLVSLQSQLDDLNLNTKEGVVGLANLTVRDPKMVEIAEKIAAALGQTPEQVMTMLVDWQAFQRNVWERDEEQEREMQAAKRQRRNALVPIWRCAVCGRADKTFIACYVAPYIVDYMRVDA